MKKLIDIACSEKTYGYLIGALLISIPLPYAFSSIALILLVVTAFFSSFFHKKIHRKSYWLPIILFFLMIFTLLWTFDFGKSVRGLERQLPFLLIPLAFWWMPKLTKKTLHQSLYLFSIGIGILGLLCILLSGLLFAQGKSSGVFFYHYLVSHFDLNAIYISVMTSLSLLYMVFYAHRKIFNSIWILFLATFLLLLSSKNLIIITVISAFIGYIITRKIQFRRILILSVLGAFILALLFYSPLKKRWDVEFNANVTEALTCEGFNDVYPWTGTSFRIFQARVFYELFEEYPVFFQGFGINAAQDLISEKQNEYYLYCGYNSYNFHNQYVQTFAELGVFGFILIVLMLGAMLRSYWLHKELMPLFLFLIMASVFLTETYIWRQRGMIHFLTMYCLIIHLFPAFKKRPPSE